MARKYRVTCARTTYFDIEIAAESDAEIERLLEAEIMDHPERCQRLGRPVHRVVEVAAAQEAQANPAQEAAVWTSPHILPSPAKREREVPAA